MRQSTLPSRRTTRPQPEGLERRSLLSGGLTDTLTTDKSVDQVGEPIQLSFTETNTSSQPVEIALAAFDDGFIVKEARVTVWQSNAGVNPMNIVLLTLQPGQSHVFTSTWDGLPNMGSSVALEPGTFTVTNQQVPDGPSATFQIAGDLSYSLTTDQTEYGAGQPIQITLTETNTSAQPITVNVAPTNFAVDLDGSTVWQSGNSGSVTTQTLQPGQAVVQSATWNGIVNTGPLLGTNVWGADFSVSSPNVPRFARSEDLAITWPLG